MENALMLARAIAAAGQVQGRVKLQKIAYLMQSLNLGISYDDYVVHHYGPYSSSLASDIDYLKKIGVIEEESQNLGLNERGEEMVQYNYSMNEQAEEAIRELTNLDEMEHFDQVSASLAQRDAKVLELAATICYLNREMGLPSDKAEKEALSIKQHLRNHLRESKELLKKLNLCTS